MNNESKIDKRFVIFYPYFFYPPKCLKKGVSLLFTISPRCERKIGLVCWHQCKREWEGEKKKGFITTVSILFEDKKKKREEKWEGEKYLKSSCRRSRVWKMVFSKASSSWLIKKKKKRIMTYWCATGGSKRISWWWSCWWWLPHWSWLNTHLKVIKCNIYICTNKNKQLLTPPNGALIAGWFDHGAPAVLVVPAPIPIFWFLLSFGVHWWSLLKNKASTIKTYCC